MKKTTQFSAVIVLATTLYFLLAGIALAQEPTDKSKTDNPTVKYCISVSDSKTQVVTDGKAITAEVKLECGATLTTDGKVIWKDGSKSSLKEGDCIDNSGATYVAQKQDAKHEEKSGMMSNK